jgi:hypothetical protein
VRNHYTPSSIIGILGGLKGFSDSTDLIDFEKESIARFSFDSFLDTNGICHSEIVTNDLTIEFGGEVLPGFPVILIEAIFNTTPSGKSR